jgi:hypothetical protein
MKLQSMHDIAHELFIKWDSNTLEHKFSKHIIGNAKYEPKRVLL